MQNLSPAMLSAMIIGGFFVGFIAAWVIRNIIENKKKTYETSLEQTLDTVIDQMNASFIELSQNNLKQAGEHILTLAGERIGSITKENSMQLDNKKSLIDNQLAKMGAELHKVQEIVNRFDKNAGERFSSMREQITSMNDKAERLRSVASGLETALTSTGKRGRWGERMAEDVLNSAGMVENINYKKQMTLKNGKRPDFTFILPDGSILNMDVKFPLNNYLNYIEASSEIEKDNALKEFIKDIKAKLKEVAERGYISPEDETLDLALIFIPVEGVYEVILSNAPDILESAVQSKISICSPISLFSILSVIWQGASNYRLDKTSREILQHLKSFSEQWKKFTDQMDKVGKKIDETQKEFDALSGTRTRVLEKQLSKLEAIEDTDKE